MAEDKIFKFKGNTIEQLKAMSREDFGKIIPSRLRRKMTRGFTAQEQNLLDKIAKGERNIKTHCRDMFVLPEMVGQKISVYSGKEFVQVDLTEETVAIRLGELVPTRKIGVAHAGVGAKKSEVRK